MIGIAGEKPVVGDILVTAEFAFRFGQAQ